MAKLLYACRRQVPFDQEQASRLWAICKRLEPDNLSLPVSHNVRVVGTLAYAIYNCRQPYIRENSILLGWLVRKDAHWETPRQEYPDGSFAIFRNDSDYLEVCTDAAGSRTIWYYFDDEYFIASTSQRAMVMFLGRIDFNDEVIPWMLSTGSLGPSLSWDKNIRRLAPDSSVLLEKGQWSISVSSRPIVFASKRRSRACHKTLLTNDIRAIVQSLGQNEYCDLKEFVIPLSGGYDSRAILCFLTERGVPANLRTLTWGLASCLGREGNDATVAKELAGKLCVEHRYLHTDLATESVDSVIDRFVHCGEGRVDHISGYTDGLEIWRRLVEEESCSGIIRGDEGFGWIATGARVRMTVGMPLCGDYRDLDSVIDRFQFPKQEFAVDLHRRKGESLSTWRDRLYHAFRLPTILAALSDIKLSYVEVISPLVARTILVRVRELPDSLRTRKALFREIVNSVSPNLAYAIEAAIEKRDSLLRKREMVNVMRKKLQSTEAENYFRRDFLEFVLQGIREQDCSSGGHARARSWRNVRSLVPRSMKDWLRGHVIKPSLDGNVLAFRVVLVIKTRELLASDSKALTW